MYNGYKNWNHWNVSLWLSNDYELYHMAIDAIRMTPNKREAAQQILGTLRSSHMYQTPDGAPYSYTAIRAAITGL